MSNDEINKLAAQEQELEAQLRAIQARKRMLQENAPLLVTLTVNGAHLDLHTPSYRSDYVDFCKTFGGSRMYMGAGINRFPIEIEYTVLTKLEPITNKTVVYNNGSLELLVEFAHTQAIKEENDRELKIANAKKPDFKISITDNKERLEIVTNTPESYILNNLWGITYSRNYYTIPLVEGYRLYALMSERSKVEWSDEALEYVKKDVEHRAFLDALAKKKDSEMDVVLKDNNKLKGFQKVALEFGVATQGNFINADTMGLGKSWEFIAFVEYIKAGTSLIVCPASLRPNWERMIFNLTGEKAYVLSGTEPSMLDTIILLKKRPRYVIINYTLLGKEFTIEKTRSDDQGQSWEVKEQTNLWLKIINAVNFDVIGLDESHYIKNTNSSRSKAARKLVSTHKICLTGTPIVNRPGELWAPLNWIAPNLFPSEQNFLDTYTIDGKIARNVEHLRDSLRTLMIRRTRADVLEQLPPINRIQHLHEMTNKGAKVYEKAKRWIYEIMKEWNPNAAGAEKQITSLLAQINRLKQIVAIDKMDTVAELANNIHDSYASQDDKSKGEGKVIIFSQFKPVVKGIAKRLAEDGVVILTGDITNTEERMKIADRFQTDPNIRYLVGTWQVMGEGLTLTAASHVIFADLFWAPGHHQQCESRAYGRMNDLHPIDAYYVVGEKTIDEWIQELLAAKLNIIEQLVEGRDDPQESIVKKLLEKMKKEFNL